VKLRIGGIASGPQSERGFTKAIVGSERKRRRIPPLVVAFFVLVLVIVRLVLALSPFSAGGAKD
jgi:hypothetical protein